MMSKKKIEMIENNQKTLEKIKNLVKEMMVLPLINKYQETMKEILRKTKKRI